MAYGTRGYQSGRGYSGSGNQRQRGQGFWNGRPEFTGAESNYDRWSIRPLTVARGNHSGRAGFALAVAGKEFYNYKKRGGAEGMRERMAQGGEEYGEQVARGLMSPLTQAPDVGSRGLDPNPTRPNPTGQLDTRPSGSTIFDSEPRDYEKESDEWEAANPYTSKILGDVTKKGEDLSVPGMVARGGKKIFTGTGRAELKGAYNEIRGGGGVPGTADPFEAPAPSASDRISFEGTTWERR